MYARTVTAQPDLLMFRLAWVLSKKNSFFPLVRYAEPKRVNKEKGYLKWLSNSKATESKISLLYLKGLIYILQKKRFACCYI